MKGAEQIVLGLLDTLTDANLHTLDKAFLQRCQLSACFVEFCGHSIEPGVEVSLQIRSIRRSFCIIA